MQIKVNGVTISVENSPVTSGNLALDNLEKQSMMLSKESEDITKMIRLYDIMSDVKAVESFGYRSTEGVGEKIANAATAVKNKLIEWFKNLIEWIKKIKNWIQVHLFKKKINDIKDSGSKSKMTTVANDINKLSDELTKESNKIVTSIDSKKEVSEEDDSDINSIKNKQKACRAAQEMLNTATKIANKLADEELKPVKEQLDDSYNSVKKASASRQKTMDKLSNYLKDAVKDLQDCCDNMSKENLDKIEKLNPGLLDDIKGVMEWGAAYKPKQFETNKFEPKRYEVNRFEPKKF